MIRRPIYLSRYDHHRLRALIESIEALETAPSLDELRRELDRAIVVPGHVRMPTSVVTIDSRVTFEDLDSGIVTEMTPALPENADPSRGAVSILDPVATALLGYTQGDAPEVNDGGRVRRLRILRVLQSPVAEAAARLVVA
ncbi:MAG: GreA/GreB family elongation factor [Opitutaceae bacterium]